MDNKFGKVSRISACAALKDGKTILEDLSFTAPYKIMTPFEKENGGIQIMPLCASAGIMAGDSQEFSYHVKEGADLEILSQSFEKIHKMDEGSAGLEVISSPSTVTLYVSGSTVSSGVLSLNTISFLLIFQIGRASCRERV
mgnify:CR=1 FL=1